ncbi:MAG TPA: GAF domain-containing protein [Clostridia bacterium]
MIKKLMYSDFFEYLLILPLIILSIYLCVNTLNFSLLYAVVLYAIAFIIIDIYSYDRKMGSISGQKDSEQDVHALKSQLKMIRKELKKYKSENENYKTMLLTKDEEQKALFDATKLIYSAFDSDDAAEKIYMILRQFTGCDRYFLSFMESGKLICRYEYGEYTLGITDTIVNKYSDTIINCFERKEMVVNISIALKDGGTIGDEIAFPLVISGKIKGVIFIESRSMGRFLDLNLSFLETLACISSISACKEELLNFNELKKDEAVNFIVK